jgi:GMP synthase (glutamine-hydrolysing)
MEPRPLCVLVTGETVAPMRERLGDFPRFFERALGDAWQDGYAVVDAREEDVSARDFGAYAGVIVTGSPSSVTERAPWMLATEEALRAVVDQETPLLGVCFGHQLLASALGGEVRKNPVGRRLGTHAVRLRRTDDPLFDGVDPEFFVNVSHEDHVAIRPTRGSIVHLCETGHDEFHAFRAGARAWGVQFHPEFDDVVVRGYVDARRAMLLQAGLDPEAIERSIAPTPAGPAILRNFVRVVRQAGSEAP